MAKAIQKKLMIKPSLIKSGGGIFDVTVDGKLIFSKKLEGRFPEQDEIIDKIQSIINR